MLLKYLTQSKIRLMIKAPLVILSFLQKNINTCNTDASHFRVGRSNCRRYYLKQELPLLCVVFNLHLFHSFVMQSWKIISKVYGTFALI